MLEELLFGKEQTSSILIIDNFENEGNAVLFSLIKHYMNKNSNDLHVFGTNSHTLNCYTNFFKNSGVRVHDTLCRELFQNKVNHQKFDYFKSIPSAIKTNNNEKKSIIFIDNTNVILANHENPFKFLNFMVESHKNPDLSSVVMLLHEDSMSEYLLNQVTYGFQTIIHVNKLDVKQQSYNYTVKLTHKNLRNGKITQTDENYVVSADLSIQSIKKVIKSKQDTKIDIDEDPLKDLTFNLHLKDDELEAKRNLVLPYELINKQNKNETKTNMTTVNKSNESGVEAKIFYEPDERDDFDDEDPDDDLNF